MTLGYGAGAGVLVGGGKENLSLQPLALEGSKGLGIAAGVSYLTLDLEKQQSLADDAGLGPLRPA